MRRPRTLYQPADQRSTGVARSLLHHRRGADARHLRVLRGEGAGDADRADDLAVEHDRQAAFERGDVLDSEKAKPGAAGGDGVSSALLGRLKRSAVLALPSEAPIEASWVLSSLWNITMLPPLSRMAIATCQEFFAASSSAAAITRLACSSVIGGP